MTGVISRHRVTNDSERIRRAQWSGRQQGEQFEAGTQRRMKEARREGQEQREKEQDAERGNVFDLPYATVHARLARSRVVPAALTIACAEHDAPIGEPCFHFAVGVCGPRVRATGLLREGAAPTPPDWVRGEHARIEPRVALQYPALAEQLP